MQHLYDKPLKLVNVKVEFYSSTKYFCINDTDEGHLKYENGTRPYYRNIHPASQCRDDLLFVKYLFIVL